MTTKDMGPHDLLVKVRSAWSDLVGDGSHLDTAHDSALIQAFRTCWKKYEDLGRCGNVDEMVAATIMGTERWREVHVQRVTDMYHSIKGTDPSEYQVQRLLTVSDPEELAELIMGMDAESTDAAPATTVDDEWIDEFCKWYKREPYVHEYIFLRGLDESLQDLARLHNDAFGAMAHVHVRYLGQEITEGEFVRRYVPSALLKPEIADNVARDALGRPEYKRAMVGRLSHLHSVLCGTEPSSDEVQYLFETQVLHKGLPLDTEELNDIVAGFIYQGEEIGRHIQRLYLAYLARDAEPDEVDEWVFQLRSRPDDAMRELREHLSSSHEFHEVVANIIRNGVANIKTSDVFKRLKVCTSTATFNSIETHDDLLQAIGGVNYFGTPV